MEHGQCYSPGPTEVKLVPAVPITQRFLQTTKVTGSDLQEKMWALMLKAPHETEGII